ncbi:hypothetical protein [Pararhizobium gei]|uniref:hypothetical protein n=1 Tax=Pararhizobium gei TaxID=1395951 RepID=UPI0023DA7AEB|nr:hypothetical protein [Rhizobium gei]
MEELAIAYWKSLKDQPKAQLYAKAIAAKVKGDDPGIEHHELMNAIDSGASFARAQGIKPGKVKV